MDSVKKAVNNLAMNEKTPLALMIISCTGVVATAVLAAKAAPKASKILAERRVELLKDKLPPLEVVRYTWKLYAPAVGIGCITIGSIFTMNRLNERNVAILTTGAALATTTLKDYQQHVLEELGAEKESKIRDKIAKHRLADDPFDQDANLLIVSGDDTWVYDALSGRYFKHNVEDIRRIENELNKRILSEYSVSLNDLYSALGLDTVEIGDILGFNMDNMIDFHFSSQLAPGNKPVVVLSYINPPVTKYDVYL